MGTKKSTTPLSSELHPEVLEGYLLFVRLELLSLPQYHVKSTRYQGKTKVSPTMQRPREKLHFSLNVLVQGPDFSVCELRAFYLMS